MFSIAYEIVDRRAGDVAEVYADPTRARQLLGWRAVLDLDAMCRDAWRWQSMNPAGYRDVDERAPKVPRTRRGASERPREARVQRVRR